MDLINPYYITSKHRGLDLKRARRWRQNIESASIGCPALDENLLAVYSFAREVIHRDRVFEEGVVARDDGDSGIGDEIFLAVGFRIVANGRAFRYVNVAIDDRATNTAVAANVYMGEQNARINVGIGVYAHVRRKH